MTTNTNSQVLSHQSRAGSASRSLITTRRRGESIFAWLLFTPAVLWVSIVIVLPIFYVIWISFFNQSYLHRGKFVGISNYATALTSYGAGSSFLLTAVFTVIGILLALVISIVLAVVVNTMRHTKTAFTVVFMLPWITSSVVTALLWQWLITPGVGIVSLFLSHIFGQPNLDLLAKGTTSMATLICVSVWKIYPFGFVLVLAALRAIPREIVEASRVDGAGLLKTFRYVILPGIRNTLIVVTVVIGLHLESSTEIPLALTGGGPAGSTNLVGLRIYQEAFQSLHVGVASALTVVLIVVNVILGFFYVKFVRSEDF